MNDIRYARVAPDGDPNTFGIRVAAYLPGNYELDFVRRAGEDY